MDLERVSVTNGLALAQGYSEIAQRAPEPVSHIVALALVCSSAKEIFLDLE